MINFNNKIKYQNLNIYINKIIKLYKSMYSYNMAILIGKSVF